MGKTRRLTAFARQNVLWIPVSLTPKPGAMIKLAVAAQGFAQSRPSIDDGRCPGTTTSRERRKTGAAWPAEAC